MCFVINGAKLSSIRQEGGSVFRQQISLKWDLRCYIAIKERFSKFGRTLESKGLDCSLKCASLLARQDFEWFAKKAKVCKNEIHWCLSASYTYRIKHSSHWTQASVLGIRCLAASTGYEPWALLAVPEFFILGCLNPFSIHSKHWILLISGFKTSTYSSVLVNCFNRYSHICLPLGYW